MTTTSSIYHFFVNLVSRRGYFADDLEEFNHYPEYMISIRSKTFPDFILKCNKTPDSQFTGGEFIELKTTKSYRIASFNSTIPTGKKDISVLTKIILNNLREMGELPEDLSVREVFYLIQGRNETSKLAPRKKVCLVHGSFFETIPVDRLLKSAFAHVVSDSKSYAHAAESNFLENMDRQELFSKTREVEGASVKVRFRVMSEVHPKANLLSTEQYPLISDDTLSFLVPVEDFDGIEVEINNLWSWNNIPTSIKNLNAFKLLNQSYEDVDFNHKNDTKIGILQHPLNGPFLLAQAKLK